MGQKVLVGVKNRGKKRVLWWGMGLGSYFCQKGRQIRLKSLLKGEDKHEYNFFSRSPTFIFSPSPSPVNKTAEVQ